MPFEGAQCMTGSLGFRGPYWGYITPMVENQMEKKMENEMETTPYKDDRA